VRWSPTTLRPSLSWMALGMNVPAGWVESWPFPRQQPAPYLPTVAHQLVNCLSCCMPVGLDGNVPAHVCVPPPRRIRFSEGLGTIISAFVHPLCAACLCCRELFSTSTLTRIERCCLNLPTGFGRQE
jgi:hypothetical protein